MKITVKRSGPADFIFIPLCILGALAALYFFWQDLNLTLQRQNEKPIGTVTWKYKAAQRRFPNRSLWDRLRKESAVYSGDFIRTAELSSATVSFFGEDGSMEAAWDSVLEINENTLIQIIRTGYGMDIELDSGGISADIRGGDFRIRSGAALIEAGAGTSLDAINTSGGLDLQVSEGSASVLEGGERKTINQGEFILSSSSALTRVIVQSLKSDMKILNNGESGFTIPFTWNSFGLASNEQVIIEIALDRQFKRIIQSIKSSGSGNENIALDSGVYYWRAYPESQAAANAASGKIEVVAAPVPHLLRPVEGEVFTGERAGVRLSWNAGAEAGAYLVEVSQDPRLAGARTVEVQSTGSENGSVVLTGLSPGKWYWRVTPLYPEVYQGSGRQSAAASFTVQQAAELAAPTIQFMPEKLYLEADKKSYFAWKQEAGAAGYTFLLSQQRDLSSPIVEEQVNNNYYSLDPVKIKLSPGDYYWAVYQTGVTGNKSPLSIAQPLVVAAGTAPAIAAGGAAASRTVGTAGAGTGAGSTQDATGTEAATPLPAPRSLQPATGSVITEDTLYRDRKLSFSWNPVPEATGYVFRLYHAGRLVLTRELTEPAFTLTQLSLLDAGNFTWQVESRGNKNGEIAENRFTVRVGAAEVQVEEGGIMFGNE